MYQREKAFLIKTAYLAAVLAVGWLILRYALVWLLPFLLALGFAALMEPAITLARRKLRLKRGFLAAVLTLALLALVIALGAVLVGQVIRQATDLMERLPELLSALPVLADRITARLRSFCAGCPEGLQQWVTQLLERLEQTASEALGSLSSALLRMLTGLVGALPQVMLFCATTALALFFTAAAYPQLMAFLRRQLSPQRRADRRRHQGQPAGHHRPVAPGTVRADRHYLLPAAGGPAADPPALRSAAGGGHRLHRRPAGVRHGNGAAAVGSAVLSGGQLPQGHRPDGAVSGDLAGAQHHGAEADGEKRGAAAPPGADGHVRGLLRHGCGGDDLRADPPAACQAAPTTAGYLHLWK